MYTLQPEKNLRTEPYQENYLRPVSKTLSTLQYL